MQRANLAHGLPDWKDQRGDADPSRHVRFRRTLSASVAVRMLIMLATLPAITSAADVEFAPAERWTTAFANEEVSIVMTVRHENGVGGTVRWSHSAKGRTLDRGTVAVIADEVHGGKAELTLSPQPLREGVVLKTTLSAAFIPSDAEEAAAAHDQTIWLFPRDPLAERSEWSAGLDIKLLDPSRKTADAFDEIELPYKLIQNLAGLNDADWTGILILGEGTSLHKQREFAEAAIETAASGRRVILLSPIDGSLALPGLDLSQQQARFPVPTELRFARHHIISELDKRLDHLAWLGTNDAVPARGLSIENHRGRLLANLSDNPHAWPFVELKYADHDGVLVMCGFKIIDHWDDGPTPRYLLIRLLEALSPQAPTPRSPLRRQ
jgi:hypothetical protein